MHCPLRAHPEEVATRLRGELAPPALGSGANLRAVQVLCRPGVPCLQLAVSWGESLGATGHRASGPLALWHAVLRLGWPASRQLPGVRPLLLGDLPLEVCQRPRERHSTRLVERGSYQLADLDFTRVASISAPTTLARRNSGVAGGGIAVNCCRQSTVISGQCHRGSGSDRPVTRRVPACRGGNCGNAGRIERMHIRSEAGSCTHGTSSNAVES